jgi:hypothetical protein
VELRNGVPASCTTHRIQLERVVVAGVTAIVAAVVTITIVIAAVVVAVVGITLTGVARCDSSGRDTPSATDAGGPLDLDG